MQAACGMWHAVCSMRYVAKYQTYGNRVGMIPHSQILVRYRTRYATRENESWHVAIQAACECKFRWGNPETDVTGRGFHEFWQHYTDSEQVRPNVHSAYTPFNTPWYAPCSSRLFKCYGPTSRALSFFNFFLHIKWYAIAMIIEPLCSISNSKRCNTDWQGGMLWLGRSASKRLKIT